MTTQRDYRARAVADRAGSAGAYHRRLRKRVGHGELLARAVRQAARRRQDRDDPAPPDAVGQAQGEDDGIVGRDEAPRDDRQGAEPRARDPVPRRAHRRGRRRAAPRHVGIGAQAAQRRHDGDPDDALYRGSRGNGRPRRGDPQGRAGRARRYRGADEADGQEDAQDRARSGAGDAARRASREWGAVLEDDGHTLCYRFDSHAEHDRDFGADAAARRACASATRICRPTSRASRISSSALVHGTSEDAA